jgi:anaerobic glycerol-3-phosphate dehydrogenase
MRHAFKDLKKQKQDMMDRVSESLNKAKEMAGAAFGATEHHVEAANEHMLSRYMPSLPPFPPSLPLSPVSSATSVIPSKISVSATPCRG